MAVFRSKEAGFPRTPWGEAQVFPKLDELLDPAYGRISLGQFPNKVKGMIEDLLYGWDIRRYNERRAREGVPETPAPGGGRVQGYSPDTVPVDIFQAAYALLVRDIQRDGIRINYKTSAEMRKIAERNTGERVQADVLTGYEIGDKDVFLPTDKPMSYYDHLAASFHEWVAKRSRQAGTRMFGNMSHGDVESIVRLYEPVGVEKYIKRVMGLPQRERDELVKEYYRNELIQIKEPELAFSQN
jgi:hypothetical protein